MDGAGEDILLLDKADNFIVSVYSFLTRPTGIALLCLVVVCGIFIGAIIRIMDQIARTFMWFYNIRGGTIVLMAVAILLCTSGWEGSKSIVYLWMEQIGLTRWWNGTATSMQMYMDSLFAVHEGF
jgi:hypothetical protein